MLCIGYTEILFRNLSDEEVSFETFAKNCLQHFIRDENCNPLEEEFLETIGSNNYYLQQIGEDYNKLLELTSDQFSIENYRSDLRKIIKRHEEHLAESKQIESIVIKMREKISNWNPGPSEDSQAFKQFMLDQLDQSSHEDMILYIKERLSEAKTKLKQADKEYKKAREEQIDTLLDNLKENISKLKQLQAQRQKSNQWLKEIYKAIKQA